MSDPIDKTQGPLSLGPKMAITKTVGGTERVEAVPEYETHVPKLVLHTHSHNPATRVEKEVQYSA
jgi:hypothetical protein